MSLNDFAAKMLPPLESELRRQVARVDDASSQTLHEMLAYHMGWRGEGGGSRVAGKRIRPLLVLLCAAAWREDWPAALPAAAAVELVHNFSLVHDDIQDNSPTRRGKPALWTKVGTPMAINAGDSLFTIAHLAMLDLGTSFSADLVLSAAMILQQACLDLTKGQFLDLAFQRKPGLSIADYWIMIEGKTSALLAASAEIGALLGCQDGTTAQKSHEFGRLLGLAFQVQDDILGIWGDEAMTGKSTASDLLEGKSSLPVLYALTHEPRFAERWLASPVRSDEVPALAQMLKDAGAYDYASQECQRLTGAASSALQAAVPAGEAAAALVELTEQLLGRKK